MDFYGREFLYELFRKDNTSPGEILSTIETMASDPEAFLSRREVGDFVRPADLFESIIRDLAIDREERIVTALRQLLAKIAGDPDRQWLQEGTVESATAEQLLLMTYHVARQIPPELQQLLDQAREAGTETAKTAYALVLEVMAHCDRDYQRTVGWWEQEIQRSPYWELALYRYVMDDARWSGLHFAATLPDDRFNLLLFLYLAEELEKKYPTDRATREQVFEQLRRHHGEKTSQIARMAMSKK